MPAKWPPSAGGEPVTTIGAEGLLLTMPDSIGSACAWRAAPPGRSPAPPQSRDAAQRLRPRALLRPLGIRRGAPPVRVGRTGLSDGRTPCPGRRRDASAVARPDPGLHRIDRSPAAPSRDRGAV